MSDDYRRDVLFSKLLEKATDDLPLFLDSLSKLQEEHDRALENARDQLINRYDVKVCPSEPVILSIPAVDSATVIEQKNSVILAMVAGVRYGDSVDVYFKRTVSPFESDQGSLLMILRMHAELSLLSSINEFTIMDNSFWSVLMNINRAATKKKSGGLSDYDAVSLLEDLALFPDSLLIRMLRNPYVIAMSKSAIADSISTSLGYMSISDKALMGLALRENEFLNPLVLGKGELNARFGIHSDIGLEDERREIDRIYSTDLLVTFYKPWAFKPAYRVEFHSSQRAELQSILQRIKYDTRHRTIIEPENQFLADRIVKSVSELVTLYGAAAIQRFPSIYGNYR